MKLKRIPDDFRVEEQISLSPSGGEFALYRLTKQSLDTRVAIDAILERWKLPRSAIAFAGLKDKHAWTTQYVTIQQGPQRKLSQDNLTLEYVGQTLRPVHASDITSNRFWIVIRDLSAAQVTLASDAVVIVNHDGFPNYFDDQRFGSLGRSGEFIARPWCLGDYERALWLAIADDNDHDGPAEQREKAILREHWGKWASCRQQLGQSAVLPIVRQLAAQPTDYRRAMALVRQDLRSLWLAAYQSHLWNQILAGWLRAGCQPDQLQECLIGGQTLPFYQSLDDSQRRQFQSCLLPLPSARLHLAAGPLQALYHRVLAAAGIELRQLRVKYPRDSFFSKGDRSAVVVPGNLSSERAADELYDARHKLTLQFELPRGAYATILIKRVIDFSGEKQDR